MAKFNKIAAIAAVAVMTVSAMAISVSAATLRDSVNQSTSYGTYQGVLTFQPYGTGRMGTASTTMLNGVAVDHITAGIGVWNLNTGAVLYTPMNITNDNAGHVSYIVTSGTDIAVHGQGYHNVNYSWPTYTNIYG